MKKKHLQMVPFVTVPLNIAFIWFASYINHLGHEWVKLPAFCTVVTLVYMTIFSPIIASYMKEDEK